MLDLSNIQGNILRGYAPFTCTLLLEHPKCGRCRAFVQQLLDKDSVTPAQCARETDARSISPDLRRTAGLWAAGESLANFPAESNRALRLRAKALGDVGDSSP